MAEGRIGGAFGIYIHWPFCAAKCPYCDFNSHVSQRIDADQWLAAYESALQNYRAQIGPRLVNSIYFGGGTPSLMPVDLVDGILRCIQAHWPLANDIEITLEANPTSIEAARFAGYRSAGVNRVSMGFQAMNDADLRKLGRMHNTQEALRAWDIARAHFERGSFDLIYARQDQSLAEWEKELTFALSLGSEHLSLYQLTIEPGTAFGARFDRGGLRGLPNEDLAADMFEMTQSLTREAELFAYEISNHARPGCESIHNMIYWTGGDYLGVGPGAHGRISGDKQRIATETPLDPGEWLARVAENGTGVSHSTALSREDQLAERLMMGLRLSDGIELREIEALGFLPNEELRTLESLGFLSTQDGALRVTESGRPLLNEILRKIIT